MNDQPNPITRFLLWLSGAPAPGAQPASPPAPGQSGDGSSGAAELTAIDQRAADKPVQPSGEDQIAAEQVEILADEPNPVEPEPSQKAAQAVVEPAAEDAEVAGPAPEALTATLPAEALPMAAAGDPFNDATMYGVEVAQADVPAGATYWRVVRVHHLTPDENHGNHHIYLDALDEAGQRINGAQARVTWEGGEQVITVDKPANEPGTNFPMWKWQVCSVAMLGLPSDRVSNLHTGHPDEPPGTGNTLFHHSFQMDFQRAVKASGQPPAASVISGIAPGLAGQKLLLTLDGEIVASQVLPATGEFSFANLAAGVYLLVVENTGVRSEPISVDGTNAAIGALPAVPEEPPTGKFIERYVLFGSPKSARTRVYLALADSYLAAQRPTFGFRAEDASHSRRVVLVGGLEDIPQAVEDALAQGGSQVQRIQGTPEEIAAAFQALQG